ncbi:hypothetical protein GD627_13435 [Arthrobacter yangruifuii]|uniref:Uncharacterized protein n=1 Tax=Arthrobacter yangruifuii TaxID=2606616 RepID=A0A5N6MIF2_9MICC|nr:hypothetical protein [Arthrobacter yangruifuii]KAD3515275.1 hypothetical protein GD627_13435 [Arthrobacter yangruifuii]
MCDKQLGAAPEAETEPVKGSGWFARLRAQPGFKTAAVAFVLTVILGVGGPAAYAYWSASTNVVVSGSTARPVLPAVAGDASCNQPFGVGVVRIFYPRVAALPPDASVVASVVINGSSKPRLYAVPNDGVIVLRDLPGLPGALSWGDKMSISVTTAYLDGAPAPGNLPAAVDETKILAPVTPASKATSAYYLASFFC